MIWYYSYELKNVKSTHAGVILFVKLKAKACNFTKCNTPPWVFFMFFKLRKCYQIVQSITYVDTSHKIFTINTAHFSFGDILFKLHALFIWYDILFNLNLRDRCHILLQIIRGFKWISIHLENNRKPMTSLTVSELQTLISSLKFSWDLKQKLTMIPRPR